MNELAENKLIGDIYEAALNPRLWRKILVSIRDTMAIDECTLFFYDAQCRARNYAEAANGDDQLIGLFLRDYIDAEVAILHENFRQVPAGLIVQAPTIEKINNQRYEQLLKEDYRNDLLKTLEVRAGMIMIHGKIISAAMGIKSFNTSPPICDAAIQFLQRLAPHIVQAFRIHNHITSLQNTFNSLYAVLNSIRYGVFLLGKTGEVLFTNNTANGMLESRCGLQFGKGGVLQHSHSDANAQLTKTIQLLLKNSVQPNPLSLNFALKHLSSSLPLQVNAMPIHHEHAEHFSTSGACMALFIKDPNAPLSIPEHYLQQAYKLTDAEISVAQALLDHVNLSLIATQRNTSIETTRWQLKQIMHKTNTNSQAELVQLLTCLATEL